MQGNVHVEYFIAVRADSQNLSKFSKYGRGSGRNGPVDGPADRNLEIGCEYYSLRWFAPSAFS